MSGWDWKGAAGKRILMTGATSGIGLAAARALAARGGRITITARDPERGRRAVAEIGAAAAAGSASVELLQVDLGAQASIRRLAAEVLERYPRLDVLVNNAGAVYSRRQLSPDGIEMTWAVNHLAPFLLTSLLLDRLRSSRPARIVTTSSDAHQGALIPFDDLDAHRGYRSQGFRRYGETKLANILFTAELARRLEGSGVTATCFHPGFVASGFNRNNGVLMRVGMALVRPMAKSPEAGADTLVWLVDSPEGGADNGGYFVDRHLRSPSPAARDADTARRLWEVSQAQTGLGGGPGTAESSTTGRTR